jgi:hypothetical protein
MAKKWVCLLLLAFSFVCTSTALIDQTGVQLARDKAVAEKEKEQEQRRQRVLENHKITAEVKELKAKIEALNLELLREKIKNNLLLRLCQKNKIDSAPTIAFADRLVNYPDSFQLPLTVGQTAFLGENTSCRVSQVLDESNMIVFMTVDSDKNTVWLSGISTKGMTDGSLFTYEWPLKITGTKIYKTVLDVSNTVFVLEPLDF